MMELNASTMALTGRSLIEASAGTGKTYTITSLYLRYIVEKPLPCELTTDQILVVTFTRAATAELRERIRRRLHFAVACFRGADPGDDAVVKDLLQRYAEQKESVLKRLYAAEKSMDEAAIYTIHGFCHRAIQANAFATTAAHAQLHESEDELLLQVVEDFWRVLVYPLTGDDYQDVQQALRSGTLPASPLGLMRQLKGLLPLKAAQLKPAPLDLALAELLPYLKSRRAKAWDVFRTQWAKQLPQCAIELKSIPRARASSIDNHVVALADWLALEVFQTPPKKSLDYLSKQVATKAEVATEGLALTEQFLTEWEELVTRLDYRPALMSQALHWVKQRLDEEKQSQQQIAPDDLMRVLSAALSEPETGTGFAAELARQYPVAMIDEFQDTDPLQFSIFQQIYQERPELGWLMIGDPKQSIYAFRGGDIHTYGLAKQGTSPERWLSLGKNYRSTQAIVQATNHLFGYCTHAEFLSDKIRYEPITSQDQGEKGGLQLQGVEQAPLQLWQFDEQHWIGETAAQQCAEQIVQLLNEAAQGQAWLGKKPVTPGDLAILVRNRIEAQSIAKALRERQVRSVFLSRDSVYTTTIALQLLQWLEAFYQPKNERLLMAALGNGLVPYTSQELVEFRENESHWQLHQQRAEHYHKLWHSRGLFTAIHHWLQDYHIPTHLMADPIQGERRLADLMHVSELLQSQALQLEGPYSLLRYFRQQIQQPDEQSRAQQLRLESDKALVQIVTIHASKGLEYPIVFIPFGLAGRQAKSAIYPDSGQQVIDFANSKQGLERADQERLAEEIRLFYVAITRAVYACYIGLARLNHLKVTSALGHLLNLEQGQEQAESIQQAAHLLTQNAQDLIHTKQVLPSFTPLYERDSQESINHQAKRFTGAIDQSWRLSSYSALSAIHSVAHSAELVPGVSDEQEREEKTATEEATLEQLEPSRFSFLKGAQAGNALHNILELQTFSESSSEELGELVGQGLRSSGIADDELWQPVVTQWLTDVLQTPLPKLEISLNQLAPQQALPEMEFFLQVQHSLDASRFNELLTQYPVLTVPVHPLTFDRFHGLLKGFIDLTFEHQGQFYVCDYKSNHLGDHYECYSKQAMEQAMADHRYDAQLILYTLALHRYLKQQLGSAYSYDQHIGGAYYLFLRGMSEETQGETGVIALKPAKALIEELDLLFGGAQ